MEKLRFKDINGKDYPTVIIGSLEDISGVSSSSISQDSIIEDEGKYSIYGANGEIKKISTYEKKSSYIAIVKDGAGVGRVIIGSPFSSVIGTMNYIETKNKCDLQFLLYTIKRIDFDKYTVGSGIPHIYYKDYKKEIVKIPSVSEQEKIGGFLSTFDKLIEKQQNKIGLLKELKKGYLQKMFPKNDANVPEIRFKGFTDTWEQYKLGELGQVVMNRRIFKDQTLDIGDVPFFKIGTFGDKPDAYITRELFEEYKSKYPYPNVGDILISASGSIGRTVEYTGRDEYFQDSNIVWLKHDNRVLNTFLKHFYSIVKWTGLEGSTIQRLYNKNILETKIQLPNTLEQEKIGTFLDSVDNLITLHQRKLDQLENLKKGYMQRLFA
jgi:type I restriction enzyme S subunit